MGSEAGSVSAAAETDPEPPANYHVQTDNSWSGLLPVGRQLLRALPLSLLVLAVAIVLNFALPRLAPGDPIDFLIPAEQANRVTAEQREALASAYGLDGSTGQQFVLYLKNLAKGDLGTSTRYGAPVRDLLADRLPWTLLLVGTSVVLSMLIGAALGFRSAWRRGSGSDVRTLTGVMVLDSFPPFFVALLLVLVFSVQLRL
ncbi:MAG TPA: ABC transporter permease, partial [Acidimicrobiales bacterium]|nr:ABC transporter permease [Acidimicrobiales bacterium]